MPAIRDVKEINLESLRDLNLGLDKSNFGRDAGYRAENLAIDKSKFTDLFCVCS